MKKLLVALLVAVMASTMVFAGGSGDKAKKDVNKNEIRWLVWSEEIAKPIAEAFMKANPGMTVNLELIPFERYEDKVRTELAAGETADLIQINDDFVLMYNARNLTQGINKYIPNMKKGDFYDSMWDFGTKNGEKYCFTPCTQVRSLYYNKAMLAAAGLPEPPKTWGDPSWTWDKFLEYCQKLTIRDGARVTQWGFVGNGEGGTEQIFTYAANGNGYFDSNSLICTAADKDGREGVRFLTDLMQKYKVHPQWGESDNGTKTRNLFLSEQAAFASLASGGLNTIRRDANFDWDVCPYPIQNASKAKWANNEPSLVCYGIPVTAVNPDGAGKLIEFMGSVEAQRIYAAAGQIPANKTVAENDFIASGKGKKPASMEVLLGAVASGHPVNYGLYTDQGKRTFRTYMHRAFMGEMSVDEAMDKAKVEVEKVLAGN